MNDWPIYLNSQIYQKTLSQIKNDQQFLMDTFKKINEELKGIQFTDSSIQDLLNHKMGDSEFVKAYNETQNQLFEVLKEMIMSKTADEVEMEELIVLKYMFYSINT